MAKNKSQYDSTLNLPKTLFEMRAGLPKKEPVMLKDWDDNDLYNQLMKHNEGKPQFILHVVDGFCYYDEIRDVVKKQLGLKADETINQVDYNDVDMTIDDSNLMEIGRAHV